MTIVPRVVFDLVAWLAYRCGWRSPARSGARATTARQRIVEALAPPGENPGNSMSQRGILEAIAQEVLADMRLDRGQAIVEVVRVRTADDDPLYQIVVTVRSVAVLKPQILVHFHRSIIRRLEVASSFDHQGLRGVSWSLGSELVTERRSITAKRPGARRASSRGPGAATDRGGLLS